MLTSDSRHATRAKIYNARGAKAEAAEEFRKAAQIATYCFDIDDDVTRTLHNNVRYLKTLL